MTGAPFRRRTVIAMAGVVCVSIITAVAVAVLDDAPHPVASSGADAFSRSALGHRGFARLLDRLGVPVLISRHDSAARAQGGALLVIEPDATGDRGRALTALIDAGRRVLIVLPKWQGVPSADAPGWIADASLLGTGAPERVLAAAGIDGTVVRAHQDVTASPGVTTSPGHGPFAAPTLIAPQLMRSSDLDPVIEHAGGMLLGVRATGDGRVLWVLSDPDVLANHGLARGDNARLALQIIDAVRGGAGPVVIDETAHGFHSDPGLWRALLAFPLAPGMLQIALVLALLLWSATGRFGKPIAPPPAIPPGKAFLIDNAAALLRRGPHAGHAVARYLQTALQDASRALHAPRDLTGDARRSWLSRIEHTRRVTRPLADLEREVDLVESRPLSGDRAVIAARAIHRWRQEMSHGAAGGHRD